MKSGHALGKSVLVTRRGLTLYSLSAERKEDEEIAADLKRGVVRQRHNIQQNLDAGARPIPGRANPNDQEQ